MASVVRVTAHAKINLFLEITGKRPDGYHTLSTLFQTISLGDELTFRPASTLRLTCSETSLPTDERNLAFRAAVRLRDLLGETRGAQIHLKKVVPMGAGLGGGSSDAAAVLTGLLKFWKRRATPESLQRLAVGLGADVPFFLKGGTCSANGIGDRLHPLRRLAKTWLVLVYPGFGVATKDAYGRVRLPFQETRSMNPVLSTLKQPRAAWSSRMFNRFEDLVFPDHPKLPELKQLLMNAGARGALMSGSGSSVFGVVDTAAQGRKMLATIRKNYPQSWMVHTI